MIWHEIIFSLCVGALISGFILTLILSIMAASNFSNQEAGDNDISENFDDTGEYGTDGAETDFDGDIDSDIDAGEIDFDPDSEMDLDSDLDFEADTEVEVETDLDSEVEIDEDIQIEPSIESALSTSESDFINFENQTPMSLIFSLYLLWFGVIGTSTHDFFSNSWMWLWLIIILICPVIFVKIVSKFWRKISKNTAYRVRVGNQLLGREAMVKIPVSSDGGTVSVKSADAVQQIGVKSLHELSWFHSGMTVYICEYKDGMYFVDDNPASVKLKKSHHRIQNKKIRISTIQK
ncbi:hypothetical protein DSAG12_00896 [Promethearchaeum syntrophicum]|uniref:Uncharacterized protein n=1 Tax=Promethearchaeum syntrophicum TaxID=2594042 RepID=A0A5B9D7R2_9ARCH|nr:hypothetical protein [Candidatus Prometheoarchaeum syntrophicum]QEE15073.1 hypothetical protein DSAG12_00896 [Candidatus Prometheoarchaeum syntrophicum]